MTKRITTQPISEGAVTAEVITDEPAAPAAPAGEKVFDFTQPVELMDAETKNVYYRLRRMALTAADGEFLVNQGRGDATLLPDGKTYTEAQVIEILGPDYLNGLVINKKCCG